MASQYPLHLAVEEAVWETDDKTLKIQIQIQIQKFKDVQARGVLHSDLHSQTDTTAQDTCSSRLKKRFAETQILGDVDVLLQHSQTVVLCCSISCKDIEKQEVLFRAGKAKKTCQSVYPAAFPNQCTGLYLQLFPPTVYPIPSHPTKQLKRPSYWLQKFV